MNIFSVPDGYVVFSESDKIESLNFVKNITNQVPLIIADPPYGKIINNSSWDNNWETQEEIVEWMLSWTLLWQEALLPGGAMYVWGGIGKPKFRPFFEYASKIESKSNLEIGNLITWSKRRGYGVNNNYLFTREECLYLVNGNAKKPFKFNIPYLNDKRGYVGYNKKYPAKSEFKRRTNVWTDITEILSGKIHVAQKAQRLHEIMIETHTNPGDWVIDLFAGCGTTALAAKKLDRKFIVFDNDINNINLIIERLK